MFADQSKCKRFIKGELQRYRSSAFISYTFTNNFSSTVFSNKMLSKLNMERGGKKVFSVLQHLNLNS